MSDKEKEAKNEVKDDDQDAIAADVADDVAADESKTPVEAEAPESPVAPAAPEEAPEAPPQPSTSMSVGQPPAAVASPAAISAPTPSAPVPEEKPDLDMAVTPQQKAATRTAEIANFYQDATGGQIQPKTYHDLYENKGTLGKIGMLFGLLVSGAGAGLAHQPNALMEMMNKELERDLEAQKTSKANKQNWYRMAMEHERMLPENARAYIHTEGEWEDLKTKKWLNIKRGIDEKSAGTSALNYSSAGALAHLQNMIDMMPPGPNKESWQSTLDNQMLTGFLAKATKRNLDTEEGKAVVEAANPPPIAKVSKNAPKDNDVYDKKEFARRVALGQRWQGQDRMAWPADAITEDDKHAVEAEIPKLQSINNLHAAAVKSFNTLASMDKAGEAPITKGLGKAMSAAKSFIPGTGGMAGDLAKPVSEYLESPRETQINGLIGQLIASGMSQEAATNAVNSWMPSSKDNSDKDRERRFEQLNNHFSGSVAASAPATTRLNLINPEPNYVYKKSIGKRVPQPGIEKIPSRKEAPEGARGQE